MMIMSPEQKKGPIAWMAHNSVAANLLMFFLLIGGIITAFIIKQEIFPEFDVDVIQIAVPYPGTSPEEVEEGIVLSIEEAIRDIEGIKRIQSFATEGFANIFVHLLADTNSNKALTDIKNAIDGLRNLPEEAERPSVSLLMHRVDVISVVLFGDLTEKELNDMAELVRQELLQIDEISTVAIVGTPPQEISIEIPQRTLRKYGITLESVAGKIRNASVDFAAGGVKTAGGEILLRVQERREIGKEFNSIPIISQPDGSEILLGDIATIIDGFADTDEAA